MLRESSKINYLMHHSDKRTSLTIKLQNIARHFNKKARPNRFIFAFLRDNNSSGSADFKERFGSHRRVTEHNVVPEH